MPNRISKSDFINQLQNNSISLHDIANDRRIPARELAAAESADLNRDGKISGSAEATRLFTNLDRYDNDGSYNSMYLTNSTSAILGHARPLSAPAPSPTPSRPSPNPQPQPRPNANVSREEFVGELQGKRIRLLDLQLSGIPNDVRAAVGRADINRDGEIRGDLEANTLFRNLDHFDRDGNANTMHRTDTINAILSAATNAPPSRVDTSTLGNLSYNINTNALDRARNTSLGQLTTTRVPELAEIYTSAARITGVPAELIAAIHGNESQFGTYRPSARGPESGFGLDPRFVSTSWGNQQLQLHGLGTWQRAQDNPTAILQSAVIAGEHLKRQAALGDITIKRDMNQAELAGTIMAYMQGGSAARQAVSRGHSWMLNPSDNNPHPLHPGGTSVGANGRTIRVAPSRKEGLLRWDVLIPLIRSQLETPR
jgi:hypothetical protein